MFSTKFHSFALAAVVIGVPLKLEPGTRCNNRFLPEVGLHERSHSQIERLFVSPQYSASVVEQTILQTPQQAADELLAADRAFSVASAGKFVIEGLPAMFADNVLMPSPTGTFAEGVAAATEALRSNPDNLVSRADWTPIRAGISSDGQQGFTLGYMKIHKPDNSTARAKYLSYWQKTAKGWRVVAYKRGRSGDGDVSMALIPPALPSKIVAPVTDEKVLTGLRTGLMQAEQAFSDEAQKIGVNPAFRLFGTADAMNMGGPIAGFVIGAEQIGAAVADGPADLPARIAWKSDKVIVASSGDLGVSLGFIRQHASPDKPGSPFFTVWRRASPTAPWRYVAE